MKIRVAKYKTHIPGQAQSRYQEKHRGVSDEGKGRTRKEGREHEAETQGVKRQTVDSRGLHEGSRKGWRARRKGMKGGRGGAAIKRGEYKEHTRVGRVLGTVSPWRTREGEKKGNAGGREMASEGAEQGKKNTDFKEDNDLCLR